MQREDEIGALARSFARMGEEVVKSHTDLNRRVRERTAQLEERTVQLQKEKERAELADKAKSGFLATVSHEMKTPLHTVRAWRPRRPAPSDSTSRGALPSGLVSAWA